MLRDRLTVALGMLGLAGAVAIVATGGRWWAFWPALLGVTLVIRPARRRYWTRLQENDLALVPLEAMWATAAFAGVAVVGAVFVMTGVGFRQSTGRGLGLLVAAIFSFMGWGTARSERSRILREAAREDGEDRRGSYATLE